MALILGNNCTARLANALTESATTLVVGVGEGAKFPILGDGDWHPLTVTKVSGGITVLEIMRVTARTGDVFTVERAKEGTVASAFSPGDRAELRFTAEAYAESTAPIAQAIADVEQAVEDAQEAVDEITRTSRSAMQAAALSF